MPQLTIRALPRLPDYLYRTMADYPSLSILCQR